MFWSEYPWWKHLVPDDPFSSFPLDRPSTPLPSGTTLVTLQRTSDTDTTLLDRLLPAACEFLYHHFARTLAHPRLTHTPDTLLGENDLLFVLLQTDISTEPYPHPVIGGTLRYHSVGTFQRTDKPIFLVDAFCIHPAWRGQGLGAFLLTTLHRTANLQGRPHALFLKEGAPLPYPVCPVRSGHYVYRALPSPSAPSPPSTLPSLPLLPLSPLQARQWMRHFLQSFPSTFLIVPPLPPTSLSLFASPSPPLWFAYRSPTASVLIGVQDAHQTWKGGTIGWVTTWLETPTVTPSLRRTLSYTLCRTLTPYYSWLWLDRIWAGEPLDKEWKADGMFHWYTYQWATSCDSTTYGITS